MYYVKKIAIGIIGWTLGFLIIRLTGLDESGSYQTESRY
jgi:hypothetical protein